MNRPITRRDFMNGIAVGVGGALASPLSAAPPGPGGKHRFAQDAPGYNPPALTGMRGSHEGSYEVAHALRDGKFWKTAGQPINTEENYDLIVVGGGISGLAAAYFFRARVRKSARILILDNHDDFGGHAKRNEFRRSGRLLLANGGTVAIDSPFNYSPEARGLIAELGIRPAELNAKCVDHNVYRHLQSAAFFDKETFGSDRLIVGLPGDRARQGATDPTKWATFLAQAPLSAGAQRDIIRIQTSKIDPMPGLTQAEKKERLSRMSYKDYLLNVVKASPEVIPFYQTRTHDLYGVGIDAVPALDCWAIHCPGFQGLGLDRVPSPRMSFTALGEVTPGKAPYFFHFPDGNASIARLLVRALIPRAVPGNSVEDVVTAKVDYRRLDTSDSPIRLRLSSTVTRARHLGDPGKASEVEISYAREARVYTARSKAVVMACWNMIIPYICGELPEKQKEALHYGVKVPLVYTTVALRDWKAFESLGIHHVSAPGMYHSLVQLEPPVSIGDYRFPKSPDQPILLWMMRTPCQPGLPARDQQRAGHIELFMTSFETFERNIRDQLARILEPGGFDSARDITGITVNRWPHGYAYEYNPLWDPDWKEGERPCDVARKRLGRITIANSDAAAAAYTDQAINEAYRAVEELMS
ncbi:MAG TPA: FAD/NAD(P)-binding protein [Terriglobia bacterium]|nr:FAD/NAD(P)-binding protein [Terriglobia bacterium]